MRSFEEIIEELLDIDRRINRLGFIYFGKGGFNPNQPRYPRGTREGGRWRDAYDTSTPAASPQVFSNLANASDYPQPGVRRNNSGVSTDEEKIESTKITVPDANGKPVNRVNIFIGGALDSSDHGNVKKSGSIKKIYGENYYATHNAGSGFFYRSKIDEFIAELPKDKEINLIGHSWGGDTAAKVAAANPGRINILVTVDPTSWLWPDFDKVKNSVGKWININAIGTTDNTGRRIRTIGDHTAGIGRSWDARPKDYSVIYIEAPFPHEYFDDMLKYRHPESNNSVYDLFGVNY